jgi:hypothetical protein
MPKFIRTEEELNEEFNIQKTFLLKSCYDFDIGQHFEAKRISVILRALLKDKGQSVSLLKQISRKNMFLSYTYLHSEEFNTQQNFLLCMLTNPIHPYLPNFISEAFSKKEMPFGDWWSEIVIKDMAGNTFSREKIILSVAEQDGGAHIDPTINKDYYELTRENSQKVFFSIGDFSNGFPQTFPKGALQPLIPPVWHTLRQIAHEVIETLGVDYNYDPRQYYNGVSFGGFALR